MTEDVQSRRDQRAWMAMRCQMLKSSPFVQRQSDPFSPGATIAGSFDQSANSLMVGFFISPPFLPFFSFFYDPLHYSFLPDPLLLLFLTPLPSIVFAK